MNLNSNKDCFKKTIEYLEGLTKNKLKTKKQILLEEYGERGLELLKEATPKRTGKTASSWKYEIKHTLTGSELHWTNSNIQDGVNVAIILQYGHGTGRGTYVQGHDYINPVLKQVREELEEALRKGALDNEHSDR